MRMSGRPEGTGLRSEGAEGFPEEPSKARGTSEGDGLEGDGPEALKMDGDLY